MPGYVIIKNSLHRTKAGRDVNGILFLSLELPANQNQAKEQVSNGLHGEFVAPLGFEPRQTDPESVVLPLHNGAL